MGQPLKILLAASEAVPLAKTGGLADVAGALTLELARQGHDVRLALPRYRWAAGATPRLDAWTRLAVPAGAGSIEALVERGPYPARRPSGATIYAIRHDPFFDRPGLYQDGGVDYPDNLERFAFFCRAVMELIAALEAREGWTPDVLHVHDWQTALCPVYLRTLYADRSTHTRVSSLLTLHNLGFQGVFPADDYRLTGLDRSLFSLNGLEFFGRVSLLKGGLLFADFLNTVSPTYAREIQAEALGFGLDGILRERSGRLVGIVNGVDTDEWNPAADPHLPRGYSAADPSGKGFCKQALQRELALPVRDVPLLAMVSRLTAQKGVDLVADALPELLALDVQVVVLGTGEPMYERLLRDLAERAPAKMAVCIGFDEALAHRIQAGADLFLMPSRYEPCGLSQLYSLRYGTIPVVRRTGGLADTVMGYSPLALREGRATGFLFGEPRAEDLLSTVLLALRVKEDAGEWSRLMRAAMEMDVSWGRSAAAYVELYRRILAERR